VVSGGLVWVGTNNDRPRDPNDFRPRVDGKKEPIDKSVLMCFRESDGRFLWQYALPRISGPNTSEDGHYVSPGCAPAVEGDRLWLITNRCETVCFDIGPLRRGAGEPRELWKVDLRKEFGVVRHVPIMADGFKASVPAPYRDRIYIATGNGADAGHINIPAPEAPSLICFDKNSGKALWTDDSPGKNIMRYQLSTPLVVEINGRGQVVHGQGDGWLRSFDALTGKLIWKCDLNAKDARWQLGGVSSKANIVATPVYYDGRVYITLGQDPEHYLGTGWLYCIDPTKEGDISLELEDTPGKGKPNPNSAVVWRFGGKGQDSAKDKDNEDLFGRTISNCTIHDGLVYAADLPGYLYCLDARTGRHYWTCDLKGGVWGTPLWVDGKVYVPTEDGDLYIFAHGRDKKLLNKVDVDLPCRSSPVFANGVLYVVTEGVLYAVQETK
jgi:outer membrane protein assembly factor BamB